MKEGVTMDRTTAYAELVVSGGRMVSRAEYLCCKRHLDDLKKSKSKNFKYFFDVDESEKHIEIANMLVVGEGTERKRLTTADSRISFWEIFSDGKKRAPTGKNRCAATVKPMYRWAARMANPFCAACSVMTSPPFPAIIMGGLCAPPRNKNRQI